MKVNHWKIAQFLLVAEIESIRSKRIAEGYLVGSGN
jgi:hypothetical protein